MSISGPCSCPLPYFELGFQNGLNQLCSNFAQLCWSLSPEYCGGLGRGQPPPHCKFWIQNNGNQLRSIVLQHFSVVPTPFFKYQEGGSRNPAPLPCEFRVGNKGNQLYSNCPQLCCNSFHLCQPLFP